MTAPTHVAFSIVLSLLFGITSKTKLMFISIGSMLPDLDHPQSTLGKVFFFISHPLNEKFGHRGFIHSIFLWLPVTVLGFMFYLPVGLIGLGAITHIILDCMNIAGVQLLQPMIEKVFVLANKKYRIATGSRNETVTMIILFMIITIQGSVYAKGGVRKLIQDYLGDFQMTVSNYEKQGLKICYLDGKFRYINGAIITGHWKIIGMNQSFGTNITIMDNKTGEVLSIPESGSFVHSKLVITDHVWSTMKLKDTMLVKKGVAFYRYKDRWLKAVPGRFVSGYIIYEKGLELGNFEVKDIFDY